MQPKATDYKRTWDRDGVARQDDASIYVRKPMKAKWKMIEEDYDDVLGPEILRQRMTTLYDVKDI